ncbi:MAG: transposase, partial [Patescibacteria group bacterium]
NRSSIGDIIGAYKSLVANACLNIYKSKNKIMEKLWQRNYYEHIIRDEKSLNKIRKYIFNNSLKWEFDENNLLKFYLK